MSTVFSRRTFLKYTAVAAVAVAGSSLLGGCSDTEVDVSTEIGGVNTVLNVSAKLNSVKDEKGTATFELSIANGRRNAIQVDRKSFTVKAYSADGTTIYNSAASGSLSAACTTGEGPTIARGKELTYQVVATDVPTGYASLEIDFRPDLQYNEYISKWILTAETVANGAGTEETPDTSAGDNSEES